MEAPTILKNCFNSLQALSRNDDADTENEVSRVIAETFPNLKPSIRVLEKTGLRCIGQDSEEDVIRYDLLRKDYEGGQGP